MFEHRKLVDPRPSARLTRRQSPLILERFQGWAAGLPSYVEAPQGEIPAIVAVGGGKGGVGKSIFSANFSVKLAQLGFKVLVIDLDLGCANMHTHFGIAMPKVSLSDFVVQNTCSFSEVIHQTAVPNVMLVPGGREETWGEFLENGMDVLRPVWNAIFSAKTQLGADFVILDLGAGTSRFTIDFFNAAHLGVVTVLPEPTSIENAYVFMRTMLWQMLENVGHRFDMDEAMRDVRAALQSAGGSFASGYADCLRKMAATHPEFVSAVFSALKGRNLGLIINQSRSQSDIDIGSSMEHISRRYFGFQADYLGYLNYDDSAWKSLRNRRLLVTDFPHSLLAKRLTKVTLNSLAVLGFYGGA
jgi:flagellar biosynthesis protein FlhG